MAQFRFFLVLLLVSVASTVAADELELTGKRWLDMHYGPYITASIESPRPSVNIAHKGLAIRVGGDLRTLRDSEECATLLFDTDLLRYASGWTGGFLSLTNVVYNGKHGTGSHPGIVGEPVFVQRAGPGWGRPGLAGKDAFADPRDQSFPSGPLPRDWAHYKGLYLHGDKVVLSYTVGETEVLELPGLLRGAGGQVLTRTLEIGPAALPMTLHVTELESTKLRLVVEGEHAVAWVAGDGVRGAAGKKTMDPGTDWTHTPQADPQNPPSAQAVASLAEGLVGHWAFTEKEGDALINLASNERLAGTLAGVRRTVAGYHDGLHGALWFYDRRGGSGRVNFADASEVALGGANVSIAAWIKTTRGGTLLAKTGDRWEAQAKSLFVRDRKLVFAVGEAGEVVSRGDVGDGLWHHVALLLDPSGRVRLYVDGNLDVDSKLTGVEADRPEHVLRLGYTAGRFPEQSRYLGLLDELRIYERPLTDAEIAALAGTPTPEPRVAGVALVQTPPGSTCVFEDDSVRLRLPPSDEPRRFQVAYFRGAAGDPGGLFEKATLPDLRSLIRGGPPRWPQKLETKGKVSHEDAAYVVDDLNPPMENPWHAWMRFGGFDFFPGTGRAAIATWSGDVWIVDGLDDKLEALRWQRIATGLFQPLGLKIVDGDIYVCGRDQITILRDLNDDGETDFYENFNNDHVVTEHFHEFAMDIQTDAAGDFYYAKGARHGHPATTARHGTIVRVSKDGSHSEILATGFRAPNGLCVNPDGSFITSDQEGNWNVANKIAWVRRGEFHGNKWILPRGEWPETFTQPLCWLHPKFDHSPAAQLWASSEKWGPLSGKLLSLAYGYGHILHVLYETVGGQIQGGAVRVPTPVFPTGIMRGRFRPDDGQLYVCGLFGWGSDRTLPGGFYRVRYTGKPICFPVELNVRKSGVLIRFSSPLDARRAANPKRFSVERWNYAPWSRNYGSKDYRVSDGELGRDRVSVSGVRVSEDGRSLFLEIPDMRTCQQMEIRYRLAAADGARLSHVIHHTVHALGEDEALEGFND